MTETVLVVAKAPAPGRSKTRLVPPLTHDEAVAVHEALLLDTLDACRAEADDVRLLHARPEDAGPLAALAPGVPLELQRGRGLEEALRTGIRDHVADGPCAVVSSDVAGLPAGALGRAFAALADGADVVLGPAHDGGYWLLAMREAHEAPFLDVPWSTPAVAEVTRERCRSAGLHLVELERWRDVDTLVDLAAVARDVRHRSAPRTAALVGSLAARIPGPADVELRSSTVLAASPWRVVLRDRLDVDGTGSEYSYLSVPSAVFVAPVTADGELLLVRQYRHPVRDWTLEVPAGSIGDGELAAEAAARELREEVGGVAARLTHLSTFFSSSAHVSLRSHAFLAEGVVAGEPTPDGDEALATVRMPFAEAVALARRGGFAEGQTALTILLAAERLGVTAVRGGTGHAPTG